MTALWDLPYVCPGVMVTQWSKVLKATSPSMADTTCTVLALEVLLLCCDSLLGWWIHIHSIMNGKEVIQSMYSCTHSIPNIAGLKEFFKESYRRTKVLYGWSVTLWEYYHSCWSERVIHAKSSCGYFSNMREKISTDLTQVPNLSPM